MDVARVTAQGRVTVPKAVRDALHLRAGDNLSFRVEGGHAVITKVPDFIGLAGTVDVPPSAHSTTWADVVARTRAARAAARR